MVLVVVMLHLFSSSSLLPPNSRDFVFFSHFFIVFSLSLSLIPFHSTGWRSIPCEQEGKKRNEALKKSRILNRRISTLRSLMLRSKLKTDNSNNNNEEHAKCIRSRSFSVSLWCARARARTHTLYYFSVLFFSLCLILFISLASATSCTADIQSRWSQSSEFQSFIRAVYGAIEWHNIKNAIGRS